MTWWIEPLRSVVGGRRVVLAGAVPPAWGSTIEAVRTAGAGDVLILATEGRGVGAAPDVPTWVAERSTGGTMDVLRAGQRLLREPSPAMLDALRAFDPDGTAAVIATFLADVPTLDGRPLLAHRRPEWLALEDKLVADALWDRAGVARQPSVAVPLAVAAAAAPSVDRGDGTVWAADARDGFHGGTSLVRWVTDAAEAADTTARFAPHCDAVRIMPFVEGVPCSIHGIVLPDGVVVVRPVEMVVMRRGHELVYGGCATFYDPPDAVRRQMRDGARAVGELLRREVDFRGTFTIDGVAGVDGFWPTELNPRFGAGINTVARGIGGVPLTLVNDLIVAGVDLGLSAAAWEAELVAAADAQRAGGTWRVCGADAVVEARPVVFDGATWRDAADGEEPGALVWSGQGFARATFAAERTPIGASVGPRACAFWDWAERELGGPPGALGGLTPAVDVHR